MEYTLRELKASDMGAVCKIISGIGIREFKDCFNVEDIKSMSKEQIGMTVVFDIAGIILGNIPKVQKDIDSFLASITGQKVSDVQNLSLSEYGDLLITVIQKDEFKDFFGLAMKLFNH